MHRYTIAVQVKDATGAQMYEAKGTFVIETCALHPTPTAAAMTIAADLIPGRRAYSPFAVG